MMWNKITKNTYQLKIDINFTVELPIGETIWKLKNKYNGEEADLKGEDQEAILDDAFDLILSRFMGDVMKIATDTQKMLTYVDNFIGDVIKEDAAMKPLGTLPADLKQKVLEMILKSKVTNHYSEEEKEENTKK